MRTHSRWVDSPRPSRPWPPARWAPPTRRSIRATCRSLSQPQQRFDGGQDIQPIFEGWTRNEDGSYLFHFGYLNRNYREQPSIAVGRDNYFSPGEEDRGQPTYFYPRTQRYQFTVPMPADTGPNPEDGIIWSVTAHGSEQRGPTDGCSRNGRSTRTRSRRTRVPGSDVPWSSCSRNRPPAVEVAASAERVGVGETLTLTAGDSGRRAAVGTAAASRRVRVSPALIPPDGQPRVPDNIRWYQKPRPPRNGLSLQWNRLSRAGRRRLRARRLPALGAGEGVRAGGGRRADRPDVVRQSRDPHRRRRLDVGDLRDHGHVRFARHVHAPGLGVRRDVPDGQPT